MTGSENNIVIGMQWGNEGKGRMLDFLAGRSGVIIRFQGCSNGGRSITAGGERFRVNYLPSGINNDGKKCLICCNVVLDLEKISAEISLLKEAGVLKAELVISPECHLILDYHKKLDVLEGRILGHGNNRTMQELGLGPCCADKFRRLGIRAGDLFSPDVLRKKIEHNLTIKNEYFSKIYGEKELEPSVLLGKCLENGEKLKPYIGDPTAIVETAFAKNLGILFEGSDGTMNDIDRGIYPYIMPASTISASAFIGTGIRNSAPMHVIGVAKSYCTRTDSGPFITEETGSVAPFIRNRGGEFAGITGEPRRIGWLDLPALKYALRENGVHTLSMTKLDVLTGIDELKICTSYIVDGKERKCFDLSIDEMYRAEPVYRSMPGWKVDLVGCSELKALPQQARAYIKFIEDYTGIPVIWIGVGAQWGNALLRRN